MTGLHDETKWSVLTTEFWVMAVVIVAILIASAVSHTFGDRLTPSPSSLLWTEPQYA